ncbi:MAG TPA: hypothetical protein PLI34_17310 [Saprospiraceae bacterium]|nr:hypothetical protein [Saprospiraceae bacterium]
MLGNILLVFITLALIAFVQLTSSPAPGGDRGVGYAFAMILYGGALFLFSGLLAWYAGKNGLFNWAPLAPQNRNLLIFTGWLAFFFAVTLSGMFRSEWHPGELPQFLKWLADAQAAVWLPLLVLVPLAVFINSEKQVAAPELWVKIPFLAGMGICAIIGLTMLFGWFRASARQNAEQAEYHQQREQSQHQHHLDKIAAHQPEDPLVNILSLTGRYHDADVRNAAVEKVKSRPDWEAELIRLLNDTEWQSYVYQFIDGNEVPHPELFVEPINRSIRRTAAEIRNSITGSNNLQDWHFEHFSIERLLRAIDEQFSKVPGADFRPAMLELLAALKTPKPERFKKVEFTLTPIVEYWLTKKR